MVRSSKRHLVSRGCYWERSKQQINMGHLLKIKLFFYILLIFPIKTYAVNILQFTRSNSLTFEMLEDTRLPNSHVYNDYDMIFTLGESWVKSPLVFKNSANSIQIDEVIEEMYSTHLGFGLYRLIRI